MKPAKRIPGPVHDLADLKKLVALARIGGKVSERTACALLCSAAEAEAFIRKAVKSLKPGNYSHSVELDYVPTASADVYGTTTEHGDWYIKFHKVDGQ